MRKKERTRKTRNKQKSRIFEDWKLFAIFVCFAFSHSSIQVYATDFGDISVKVESITSGSTGTGYEEFRATIINHSPDRSHQVTLITPESPVRNYGPRIVELKRTVDVSPSSTAKISLYVPPLDLAGIGFAVVIDGRRQQDAVSTDAALTGAWVRKADNRRFVLISQSVGKSGLMNQAAVETGLKGPSGNNDVAYLPYGFPLNEWSTNWLGYSKFDGVIVTADDIRAMPESVRSALWRYLECGGSLFILGSYEPPRHWQSRRLVNYTGAGYENSGVIKPTGNDLPIYFVGFGVLVVSGTSEPASIDATQWSSVRSIWEGSRQYDSYFLSLGDINREFPVIDNIGVPVRGLFLLMILFVIVIGPINLIWLARRKKKLWLLWTVPAISLLTCLAVSAFSLFNEGLSATSRTEVLTILDETEHRATTIGWTAFYSPVTPGEGLHFSYDTELMPQLLGRWEYSRSGGLGRTIDWTSDQHLVSEWITARIPAYFKIRKSETRRERLTISHGSNDSHSVVNGLGADIRQLWWADASGKLFTATNIPAGAQSTLTTINVQAEGAVDSLRNVYLSGRWLDTINSVEINPRKSLGADCYLAVMDASPFVEEGLKGVKTRKAKTVVYGIPIL